MNTLQAYNQPTLYGTVFAFIVSEGTRRLAINGPYLKNICVKLIYLVYNYIYSTLVYLHRI